MTTDQTTDETPVPEEMTPEQARINDLKAQAAALQEQIDAAEALEAQRAEADAAMEKALAEGYSGNPPLDGWTQTSDAPQIEGVEVVDHPETLDPHPDSKSLDPDPNRPHL